MKFILERNKMMMNVTKTDENLNLIRQVIENYADGADKRDDTKLEKAFHEDFRVIALTAEGIRHMDKQTYLTLIRDEKIGGVDRTLEIEWITSKNDTARAEIRLKSPMVTFFDDLSFIKNQTGWQIVNNITQVMPN
jgi:hypothetical protein